MQDFEFVLMLSRKLTGSEIDALYEAGFDGSAIGSEKNQGIIEVVWQANNRAAAVANATAALKQTVPTIRVVGTSDIKP